MNKLIYLIVICLLVTPISFAQDCSPAEMEQVFTSALKQTDKEQKEHITAEIDRTFKNYEDDFIAYSDDKIYEFKAMIKDILLMLLISVFGFVIFAGSMWAMWDMKKKSIIFNTMSDKIDKLEESIRGSENDNK